MSKRCVSCRSEYAEEDKSKHYRSEWHIYNLKRIVSSLPPISEVAFLDKQQCFVVTTEPIKSRETYCASCKKTFINDKSYTNHLNSKKHLINVSLHSERPEKPTPPPPVNVPEEDTDIVPESLPLGACLFCDKQYSVSPCASAEKKEETANLVLQHMSRQHSFSVPYPEHLINPAGLLLELGRIVGEERACIGCGRQFYYRNDDSLTTTTKRHRITLTAVRQHMLDKPEHKKIWCGQDDPVLLALAIAEAEEADPQNMPSNVLVGGEQFSRFYDQTVAASSFLMPDNDDEVYEVRLPSGTVLGHRNMRTVYQQHLQSGGSDAEVRRQAALPSSATFGRPLHLCGRTAGSALVSAGTHRPFTQLNKYERSGESIRHCKVSKLSLDIGLRGNLVLRGHLRRQY